MDLSNLLIVSRQGILSGQGAVGFVVGCAQFLSSLANSGDESTAMIAASLDAADAPFALLQRQDEMDPIKKYKDNLRLAAFIFFLVATIYSALAFLAHLGLVRLPFYRLTIRASEESRSKSKEEGTRVSMKVVERKIRVLGLAVFGVFFVTLSVFPSITSSILSVNDKTVLNMQAVEMGGSSVAASPGIFTPTLFVPLGFIVFNAG